MSGRWSLLAVVLITGCHGLPHKAGKGAADRGPGPDVACADTATSEGAPNPPSGPSCPAPAGCAKPQVEVCKAPPDIQVNVPRQKIVLPRRACGPAPNAAVAGAPAGLAGAAGRTVTEQQQLVQTRQVVLMPQQVLVPFVQTTVSGPIRVTDSQETSVLNVATTSTTGAAIAATGPTTVVAGAAGLAGVAGANLVGAAPAGAANANAGAAGPQNMAECLAQLRAYELRINQLLAQTEALAAQVEALKGGIPAPRPKP